MVASGRGIQPLLETPLALYPELVDGEALECEWSAQGCLFAYRSSGPIDAYAATDRLLGESFHSPAERFEGDEVVELEPALKRAGRGWYYHDDAHLRPDELMLAGGARASGGRFASIAASAVST